MANRKLILPKVPCRVGPDTWRVWGMPREAVVIANREGVDITIRTITKGYLSGTATRHSWRLLHLAITLELKTCAKLRTRARLEALRSQLNHLIGYHPALGDEPKKGDDAIEPPTEA